MFCRKCGNQLEDGLVTCPQCGEPVGKTKVKKPLYKKWWFWVLMGLATIVTIAMIGSSGNTEEPQGTQQESSQTVQTKQNTENKKEEAIQYEVVDLQAMLDALDGNALKAEKTYQDKNVEVTGKIANFDSDGSYITIEPVNADTWNFDTVMCYIKNDAQLNFLLEKQKGDTVTVKGKIISIGEVLGYSINIAEVY